MERTRNPVATVGSVRALLLILAASAVAGCGGDDAASTASTQTTTTIASAQPTAPAPKKAVRTCVAGTTERLGTPKQSFAAVVRGRAQVFRTPDGRKLASFGPKNVNGVPTVFGVLAKRVGAGCGAQWYRVQLPLKPNGSIGWVRASDVELARHPLRPRRPGAERDRRHRLGRDADTAGALLREPEARA
jgi:hypothetical protein